MACANSTSKEGLHKYRVIWVRSLRVPQPVKRRGGGAAWWPFSVSAPLRGQAWDTLRLPATQQMAAHHEQVGKRTGHEQAMGVLGQAAIADLREAEHPFDDADGMLDLGPHLRLGPVLRPLGFVHDTVVTIAA